jgi:TPR repeat protein
MSHISKIELEVRDLAVLGQACTRLGMKLIRGQRSFRWYGKEAQCDHAIRVPGANYEIGVVYKSGLYELNCDFYDPNIEKVIGRQGGLLKQAYAVEKTMIEARKKGYSVLESQTDTGIRLQVRMS